MKKQKQLFAVILVFVFFIGVVFLINKSFNINRKNVKIENVIKISSKKFEPNYKIVKVEFFRNVSSKNLRMIVCKIVFSDTLSQEDIRNNLRAATIQIYNEYGKPYRLNILAYREQDNINSIFTIAQAQFFPGPKFDIEKSSLKDYIFSIEFAK